MSPTKPDITTSLSLTGDCGPIENVWQAPDGFATAASTRRIGVICHPHPLYQGTMDNKVVSTIARGLRQLNIASLRFNFRGVGASAGSFAAGSGEKDDVLLIIEQLQQQFGACQIILAGFSFGAYVAALASCLTATSGLILVAPPVAKEKYYFPEQLSSSVPKLIIAGSADDIADSASIGAWAQKQQNCRYSLLEASHFFHGKLVDLRQELCIWAEGELQ